jgi:hypothetical protein
MDSYFRHLFVELYYHQTQLPWRRIPAVSRHVVYRIHLLFNAVYLELLLYNFVVPLDRGLLGSYESTADRPADLLLLPVYPQERLHGYIEYKGSVITWASRKGKHCKADNFDLRGLVSAVDWSFDGVMCVQFVRPPALMCKLFQLSVLLL